MKTIGFIGLGIMGKPMSKNLLKAGYPLVVYDINEHTIEELCAVGAKKASSPKEVASKGEWLITMLPNSPGKSFLKTAGWNCRASPTGMIPHIRHGSNGAINADLKTGICLIR